MPHTSRGVGLTLEGYPTGVADGGVEEMSNRPPGHYSEGERQDDRILIPSIDVDKRFKNDRITGSWIVDQGSTLLLLLEI